MQNPMVRRPNLVRIDPSAISQNLALVRSLVPAGTGIYQVCKGDGYGLGLVESARYGVDAGLDTFCVGTPEEATALRAAMPDVAIMLFPGAQAEDYPALAAHDIILTVHNAATLRIVLEQCPSAAFEVKVNTGLHRYGFDKSGWATALDLIAASGHSGLRGIYSHVSQGQDAESTARSIRDYQWFLDMATELLGRRLPSMVAASPTVMKQPGLPFDRIDPGRALYGMLSPEEAGGHRLKPIVQSVTSKLVDCHLLEDGAGGTVGYSQAGSSGVTRVGVMPIGHYDGLPAKGPLGSVLIRGREVPVVSRTLLASLLDLSDLPDAEVGDEIVLVGKSGALERDIFQFAATMEMSAIAMHFGFIRSLPKQVLV